MATIDSSDISSHTIHQRLELARQDLLDLSGRNRLLNTSRSAAKSSRIDIVNERSAEVFRILVAERRAMQFLAGEETTASVPAQDEFAFDDDTDGQLSDHHIDLNLQTRLGVDKLHKSLLKLMYDAKTTEEEQGVNTLYLALGFLKWFEPKQGTKERFAPLILVPIRLDRDSVRSRFRVRWTEEDLTTNLSLQEKLRIDFNIALPSLPDTDDIAPEAYFDQVSRAISSQKSWQVLRNDMLIWFFSFAKFLMYRDLLPESWPAERELENHALLSGILERGVRDVDGCIPDDCNIDTLMSPVNQVHVTDADSSQSLAIEDVRQGRNLVIQGPPGTGKSQTITNIIASAVRDGKKVLFVAEKQAALEVVKRRLDSLGIGEMCLELHSHKANKRAVLDDLSRTLELGRPSIEGVREQAEELGRIRDRLNSYVQSLHAPIGKSNATAFKMMARLIRLRAMGQSPAEFSLPTPWNWDATTVGKLRRLVEDLQIHLASVGNPAECIWRGVRLTQITPLDVDRFQKQLPNIVQRIATMVGSTAKLAANLSVNATPTLRASATLGQLAQRLVSAPPMDRQCLVNSVWENQHDDIADVIGQGRLFNEARDSLAERFSDIAWDTDVSKARRNLAVYGRSLFRIFRRDYREAIATMRGIVRSDLPKAVQDRIAWLDELIGAVSAKRALDEGDQGSTIGRAAFGSFWKGSQSDWDALEKIHSWEAACRASNAPSNFRAIAASLDGDSTLSNLVASISRNLKPLLSEIRALFEQLKFDISIGFNASDLTLVPLTQIHDRLALWQQNPAGLTKWVNYFGRWSKLDQIGLKDFARQLSEGKIANEDVISQFDMAYCESMYTAACQSCPQLNEFSGLTHSQVITHFRELDRRRLSLTRAEVARAHYDRIPRQGGEIGEIGIVRREAKKKRRIMPLRRLLQEAGHAVQAIKPVFMMSPISIAQFLEPGILEFDLLLMDEASQVTPVDALGAIARARQIVVVGDEQQLPPTQFFSKVGAGEDDVTEDFAASDLESILGLCSAQNIPQRMLRWHYRSKHHSLIAVSNREFYDSRLFVVPSPMEQGGSLGLVFRHVREGVFDRGGSATNRIEARRVAEEVIAHARNHPQKSLGVGAFSVAQRDAILDEIELLRRESRDTEQFFMSGGEEPFFVKNLENIQGDERDVILISIGYARDSSGYMAMSFGPLAREGGERRLNVLISRAKERCVVFSSMTDEDIDLNRAKSRGARALKTFLAYARTGILEQAPIGGGELESEFEEEVAEAITRAGYAVDAQVGVGGFRIDLAVLDPDRPGRYVLGVECDGATYHSSRSARDRDRIRQVVLEDRGWRIHRIWSTDWFREPQEQLQLVLDAIEDARRSETDESEDNNVVPIGTPGVTSESPEIARESSSDDIGGGDLGMPSEPYIESQFSVPMETPIHLVPVQVLSEVVTKIADVEGPIHKDEIARRSTTLWGLSRAGSRIKGVVYEAITAAQNDGRLLAEGDFVDIAVPRDVRVRNRESVQSSDLRKPEMLPPSELRAAAFQLIAHHAGLSHDDVAIEVSRVLGFKATSNKMKQIIREAVDRLISESRIEQRQDKLYTSR